MVKLEWRVVDDPAYKGFLAANIADIAFSIDYSLDHEDEPKNFWLSIRRLNFDPEFSKHANPYDAMKAAQTYVNSLSETALGVK